LLDQPSQDQPSLSCHSKGNRRLNVAYLPRCAFEQRQITQQDRRSASWKRLNAGEERNLSAYVAPKEDDGGQSSNCAGAIKEFRVL